MVEKLAIDGGEPVVKEPLPGWPQFPEEIVQAAMEPLRTGKVNYWTGTKGMEFEKKYAEWNDSKFAISTCNGTAALHVPLMALQIGPGDEVIVPSYSFIATCFCVLQACAVPVFADVNRDDHCISPEDIERKITDRTRAIIPVHLYGNVCDMDAIMAIAEKHDLHVIEDAAEAHGGTFKGKKVGTFGIAGSFSFCQNKTFTTGGEGGMIVTDDEDLAWKCRSVRDHGYDVRERMRLLEMEAKLPYIHERLGWNYRMTEMQSVIGLCELARMDTFHLPRRRRNGELLISEIKDLPEILHLPVHNERDRVNGFYVFPIVVDADKLTVSVRDKLIPALAKEGIPVAPVFWPQSYKEGAFHNKLGFGTRMYPFEDPAVRPGATDYSDTFCANAAWLEERTFITFCHPMLEEEHMSLIARAIKKVLAAYSKSR